MAAYPSVGLRLIARPRTSRRNDVSVAGTIRSIDLSQTTVYDIRIVHPIVDSTDRTTLLNFYDTNKGNVNTLTHGGDTWDLTYENAYAEETINASLWNLSVEMVGVKQ